MTAGGRRQFDISGECHVPSRKPSRSIRSWAFDAPFTRQGLAPPANNCSLPPAAYP